MNVIRTDKPMKEQENFVNLIEVENSLTFELGYYIADCFDRENFSTCIISLCVYGMKGLLKKYMKVGTVYDMLCSMIEYLKEYPY